MNENFLKMNSFAFLTIGVALIPITVGYFVHFRKAVNDKFNEVKKERNALFRKLKKKEKKEGITLDDVGCMCKYFRKEKYLVDDVTNGSVLLAMSSAFFVFGGLTIDINNLVGYVSGLIGMILIIISFCFTLRIISDNIWVIGD